MQGAGAICALHSTLPSLICMRPWLFLLAVYVCIRYLSPDILSSFLSCRLIALDNCPGMRPIGVCEVARRIIAKAALSII